MLGARFRNLTSAVLLLPSGGRDRHRFLLGEDPAAAGRGQEDEPASNCRFSRFSEAFPGADVSLGQRERFAGGPLHSVSAGKISLGRAAVTVIIGRLTTWLNRRDIVALQST